MGFTYADDISIMGFMRNKKRATMIEFKRGDKVRVGYRMGKVLAVIQGYHAGTLLLDIPKDNHTWGHYKPSEVRRVA